MRREGRQHGVVRAIEIVPYLSDMKGSSQKFPRLIGGPFMGVFAKAPAKPTNGSRYTSRCRKPRCRNCHDHPAAKAKAKTKGNHKHRDEFSDFYSYDGASEEIYALDEESGGDGGQAMAMTAEAGAAGDGEIARLCGGAGDCEDGGWVLVEGV